MKPNQIASFYDQRGRAALLDDATRRISPSLNKPYEFAYEQMVSRLPADAEVLDFACGTGIHSVALAGHGFSVVGVDLSELSITAAKASAERFGVQDRCKFYQGNEDHNALQTKQFDAIFVSGALYYLDLDQFADWFSQHLKTGGIIVAIETLGNNLLLNLYRRSRELFANRRDQQTLNHLLTPREISRLGQSIGQSKITYFDFLTLLGRALRYWPKLESAYARLAAGIDRVLLNYLIKGVAFKAVLVSVKGSQ